jgi:hypothetical protein
MEIFGLMLLGLVILIVVPYYVLGVLVRATEAGITIAQCKLQQWMPDIRTPRLWQAIQEIVAEASRRLARQARALGGAMKVASGRE